LARKIIIRIKDANENERGRNPSKIPKKGEKTRPKNEAPK
jgi:hypothetical protein